MIHHLPYVKARICLRFCDWAVKEAGLRKTADFPRNLRRSTYPAVHRDRRMMRPVRASTSRKVTRPSSMNFSR
jgi:hypothetical protein